MTATPTPTAPIHVNACPRCGLPINKKGAFSMSRNHAGQLVYQHTTCPTSAVLAALPTTTDTLDGLPYLSIAEAAHLLRVSASTIRARIRRRLLPAWRLRGGQTVLVRREDVVGLLDAVHETDHSKADTAPQGHRAARLDAPADAVPDSDRTAAAVAESGEGIGAEPPLSEWPTALLTRRASDAKGNYPGGMEALRAEEAELNRRSRVKT